MLNVKAVCSSKVEQTDVVARLKGAAEQEREEDKEERLWSAVLSYKQLSVV